MIPQIWSEIKRSGGQGGTKKGISVENRVEKEDILCVNREKTDIE